MTRARDDVIKLKESYFKHESEYCNQNEVITTLCKELLRYMDLAEAQREYITYLHGVTLMGDMIKTDDDKFPGGRALRARIAEMEKEGERI
jgi:hypothetical protein